MRKLLLFTLLVILPTSALAWNEKGHMVTARLAWRQLTPQQRDQIVAILKQHPHYEEHLAAHRPNGFSEDEWVFMRATTWADWVRGRQQFDHPTWHYINYPIVPPGSSVNAADHEPPAKQENVVNQLSVCVDKIRAGTDEEKAVYLTWLLHLVGDIHQPLHCTAVLVSSSRTATRAATMPSSASGLARSSCTRSGMACSGTERPPARSTRMFERSRP